MFKILELEILNNSNICKLNKFVIDILHYKCCLITICMVFLNINSDNLTNRFLSIEPQKSKYFIKSIKLLKEYI